MSIQLLNFVPPDLSTPSPPLESSQSRYRHFNIWNLGFLLHQLFEQRLVGREEVRERFLMQGNQCLKFSTTQDPQLIALILQMMNKDPAKIQQLEDFMQSSYYRKV